MKIKSILAKPFASYIYRSIRKDLGTALGDQEAILKNLLRTGSKTVFGREHHLEGVKTYEDFRDSVPVRDYEQFKPYIDQIKTGETQCIMARTTHLFCEDLRHNEWCQIHPDLKRLDIQSY